MCEPLSDKESVAFSTWLAEDKNKTFDDALESVVSETLAILNTCVSESTLSALNILKLPISRAHLLTCCSLCNVFMR